MIANQILQLKENLDNSRRAVSVMGGTVGEIPAFDNLAAEIDSIPVGDANYAMVVDDGVAFRKNILPGALPNAKLVSVGGMTYKSKNLVDIPFIDATTNEEGITISVNWTSPIYISAEECATTSSSVWRFRIDYIDGSSTHVMDNHLLKGGIRVAASANKSISAITYRGIRITEGKYSGIMISYGKTRVPYEPYYNGLRDTKITAVKVNGADGTEKASRQLPSTITSLDGWGKGIDGYSNTYDFESGTYTKRCVTYTFTGGEDYPWVFAENSNGYYRYYIRNSQHNIFPNLIRDKGVSNLYNIDNWDNRSAGVAGNFYVGTDGTIIFVVDATIHAEGWTNYLKRLVAEGTPLTVVVSSETPTTEEVPVAFDYILAVEGGGSIEFINEHNQSAPSDLRYMRRLV